mmetsp:Transcript_50598/g.141693  ORF Transcript_50598/g.141693 Transcript_50598/m.141693 type:complete len:804 (+) Transcript_50598:122-2533(+)
MFAEKIQEKLASLTFRPTERRNSRRLSEFSLDAAKLKDFTASESTGDASCPADTSLMMGSASPIDAQPSQACDGEGLRVAVRCRRPSSNQAVLYNLAQDVAKVQGSVCFRIGVPDNAVERPAYAEEFRRFRSQGPRAFRCHILLGPSATQEDVFEQAAPIVEKTMEGQNGSIFCYGVTGAGKTYTMFGPLEAARPRDATAAGIAPRAAQRIFGYIRDVMARGDVFIVEASFLQIYTHDGSDDQLFDLLSDDSRKLDVKQDPFNEQAFVCDGLRRVPIRTPDEMRDVIGQGQRRSAYLEAERKIPVSRSHCVLTLLIERLSQDAQTNEPVAQRSKLMLVDLAGSDTIKGAQAPSDSNVDVRRTKAMETGRMFASVVAAINGTSPGVAQAGVSESALMTLLRDCLSDTARTLFIANISAELANIEEAVKTLQLVQQTGISKAPSSTNRTEQLGQDHSSLLQMRQRHADCIRMLQERVVDSQDAEVEERNKLQQDIESLNRRLANKETTEKTFDQLHAEHFKKIDELRNDVSHSITSELEKMRVKSLQDMDHVRMSMESHVSSLEGLRHQQQTEEHNARMGKMQGEHQEALRAHRAAEEDASKLRVQLASSEERAKMLLDRQEELRRERADLEEERRNLRNHSDQQWQRLSKMEVDLHRFKAQADAQSAEIERLVAAKAEDADVSRRERQEWRAREEDLQRQVSEVQQQNETMKRELDVFREQAGLCEEKNVQLERLRAQLEAERHIALEREENHIADRKRLQAEFEKDREEAAAREAELMLMLHEVQDSIITAGVDAMSEDDAMA